MICGSGTSSPGTPRLISQSSSIIDLAWTEPYDNGGTEILSYTLEIIDLISSTVLTFNIIDSLEFHFEVSNGLVKGTQYQARVYANNFVTNYVFTTPVLSTYSGELKFFTSELVENVPVLTSSSITMTSAIIQWNLLLTQEEQGFSTSALVYYLQVDNGRGGLMQSLFTTTTANSYTLTGVTPGSTLRFRMYVQNNMGYSNYSNIFPVLFAVAPDAPLAPQFVQRSGDNFDGLKPYISISWTPPVNNGGSLIQGYLVQVKEGLGAYSVLYNGLTDPETTLYRFEQLNAGSSYYFQVIAVNQIGQSSPSPATNIYAATIPKAPQTTPQTSSVVLGTSSASLAVTWSTLSTNENGGSLITGYYIQINQGSDTDYVTPGTLISDPLTTTHTFTGLAIGVIYKVRYAAINDIFTSNCLDCILQFSQPLEQMTALIQNQVTGLAQDESKYKVGTITMKWDSISPTGTPTLSYVLLKDNGLGVFFILYQGLQTFFQDRDLIAGQTYNYRIYATNYLGNGP
jgi:hypothetical protein